MTHLKSASIGSNDANLKTKRWRETEAAIGAAERGEVVPGEEVLAWLDSWGSRSEKEPNEPAAEP